jgi:hypothetical protein
MASLDESCLSLKFAKFGLGDATEERRPPNAARTKQVPQTFNPALFGRRFWRTRLEMLLRVKAMFSLCRNYFPIDIGFHD